MYIYIVTLLVKNTENISEFLLYYLVNPSYLLKQDSPCLKAYKTTISATATNVPNSDLTT